jgi:hypothetical protein
MNAVPGLVASGTLTGASAWTHSVLAPVRTGGPVTA